MPKFSIIIPVYNVEKYIGKCLDSVINQTYQDYEVIVVNDGTKDDSMDIVKKYDVKIVNQQNQGLSAARNTGVKEAKGEYILFLDSDDSIEKDLLKELNKAIKNNPDLVRFQVQEEFEGTKEKKEYPEQPFTNKTGVEAFSLICKYHFVENAWCYLYKTDFFKKQHFTFKNGALHEDFGLIPLIIMKARKVNSISYVGYNYLQRQGSIMNTKNYDNTKKKASDMIEHYQYLENEINKTKLDSKVFKSFISNSLIIKICELKNKDYKEYKKILKELNVYDNILADTLLRKIKKALIRVSPKLLKKII